MILDSHNISVPWEGHGSFSTLLWLRNWRFEMANYISRFTAICDKEGFGYKFIFWIWNQHSPYCVMCWNTYVYHIYPSIMFYGWLYLIECKENKKSFRLCVRGKAIQGVCLGLQCQSSKNQENIAEIYNNYTSLVFNILLWPIPYLGIHFYAFLSRNPLSLKMLPLHPGKFLNLAFPRAFLREH